VSNLLKNPGFEGDWTRDTHLGIEFAEIFTPEGWVTWWSQEKKVPHDPENRVGYAKPETKVIPNKAPFVDPPRVRSGQKGFLLFTFWRIHDAGLYQRVTSIQPGTRFKASAWGHAWSNQADDAYHSIDDDNIALRIGIDPAGGTDPFSDNIVWGKPQYIYDKFGQVSVKAQATGDAVTVFLRSSVLWPYKHCDVYWDDAALEVVSAGSGFETFDINMRVTPVKLQVGQVGSISIITAKPLSGVSLTIIAPDGASLPVEQGQSIVAGNKYVQTYRFRPLKAGDHQARLTDREDQNVLAQQRVEVAPSETGTKQRGQPREQYERVYVLLPLGGGSEWIQAIIDSGRWDEAQWTIGASADDAGVGDLDKRTVLAINPGSWPGDLRAFFAKHYPGLVYKPLPAASPQKLRDLLREGEF